MKSKIIFLIIVVTGLLASFLIWQFWPRHQVSLKKGSFSQLAGWKVNSAKNSLEAFQRSCKVFLRQDPEKSVGSKYIDLKAKDWQPACKVALSIMPDSDEKARAFFETWFTPVAFHIGKPVQGLFTGYYMPLMLGSLTQTKEYTVPIYGLPSNRITVPLGQFDSRLKFHRTLVGRLSGTQLVPFFTRKEIGQGAIDTVAPVLVWIHSKVDRQFLEIEGSGVVQLTDGSQLFLGYAGENGAPYTSIAQILINKGVMTRDNASMQRIRRYFKEYPQNIDSVLDQNQSFVFFDKLPTKMALGAQGVGLTPGYSLAIDRKWIPMGIPIWLDTHRPKHTTKNHDLDEKVSFKRLMVAQDTGGAINGAVRGDVYWGTGKKAIAIAGHMKHSGYYWLLLPNNIAERLENLQINAD